MEVGLDSLGTTELQNQIKNNFNVQTDSTLLFNYPTINDLIKYILDNQSSNNTNYFVKSDVDNLIIELTNIGKIEFLDNIDTSTIDINNVIINKDNIEILDEKLNNVSYIATLYNFINPIGDATNIDEIRENIIEWLSNQNKQLLSFNSSKGSIKYMYNSMNN